MDNDVLILIQAPLHYNGFPRMVLRSLNNQPLLTRILNVARHAVGSADQILVLTDDDEVALMAERNGYTSAIEPTLLMPMTNGWPRKLHAIVRHQEKRRGRPFSAVMLLRPFSPLISSGDLSQALRELMTRPYDTVLSATIDMHGAGGSPDDERMAAVGRRALHGPANGDPVVRETASFVISKRHAIDDMHFYGKSIGVALVPPERTLHLHSLSQWWICERLLRRRRVVFVVVGYTEVGMGHVYRATHLAHELVDHDVHFVCTRESALAVTALSAQPYPVYHQGDEDIAETVLALEPDLVINDVLNTEASYIQRLQQSSAKVLNFEDLGSGAEVADWVVNDIYMEASPRPNHVNGPDYFMIRDEFLQAAPKAFSQEVREVLITFGGTDSLDLSWRIARIVLPVAIQRGLHVSIVTGPGYLHAERLRRALAAFPADRVELANGTKRMSEYMARADLAFSSAGRTVFELAAMRVPSFIIASNRREETHTFASKERGMVYMGGNDAVSDAQLLEVFCNLLDSPEARRTLYDCTGKWNFHLSRIRVMELVNGLFQQKGELQPCVN
jgi:spore coat polysaccharide biosynthesis predicted glycosyltransferase SpsG